MINLRSKLFKKITEKHLSLKIALIIACLSFFSLTFISFLMYAHYNTLLSHHVNKRFSVIAEDLSNTLSDGLNLGFSLRELSTTQRILEDVQRSDPHVLSISVFEVTDSNSERMSAGKVIYSTRPTSINGNTPLSWVERMEKLYQSSDQKFWLLEEEDVGGIGVPLSNNFKQVVGGIIIKFDQKFIAIKLFQFAQKAAIFTTVSTLLLFFLLFWIFHFFFLPLSKSLKKMHTALLIAYETRSFVPFMSSNDMEEEFYAMYRKTKSLFDVLEMIENNTHIEIHHEKRAS